MRGKLLLVSPKLFDYQRSIQNILELHGWEVKAFSESPGFWGHVLRKILPKLYVIFQKRRFKLLLKESKYDFLFLIRGWTVPVSFPKDFKLANPYARLVMYQWDSKQNNNYESLIPHFDASYSFDRKDCEEDIRLIYKPLFYKQPLSDTIKILDSTNKKKLMFVASYQKKRYSVFKDLQPILQKQGFNIQTHIYINPFNYLKLALKRDAPRWQDIRFISIKSADLEKYYKETVGVLDICNASQSGLTMRSIETLGNRRILITNNKWIKLEPFYNDKQIIIFQNVEDLKSLTLPSLIDTANVANLNISNWLNDLLEFQNE
jgi:hypothetical protein